MYFLAKYLDQWFKSRINLDKPLSFINSVSLVSNIQKVVPPEEAVRISFDVIALFPSILKQATVDHTCHLYIQSHVLPGKARYFIDLLDFCWSSNTCLFRERFYSFPQTMEILVGPPSRLLFQKFHLFSSLFSHVYIHHFDSNSLTPAFLLHIHFSYRYVDDVLCL